MAISLSWRHADCQALGETQLVSTLLRSFSLQRLCMAISTGENSTNLKHDLSGSYLRNPCMPRPHSLWNEIAAEHLKVWPFHASEQITSRVTRRAIGISRVRQSSPDRALEGASIY